MERCLVSSWTAVRVRMQDATAHGTVLGFLMERCLVSSLNGARFPHGTVPGLFMVHDMYTYARCDSAKNVMFYFSSTIKIFRLPRSLESVSGFLMERSLVSSWNGRGGKARPRSPIAAALCNNKSVPPPRDTSVPCEYSNYATREIRNNRPFPNLT